jgi:dipeptidyl aminopeptidase/acylaminoacyl peptidase
MRNRLVTLLLALVAALPAHAQRAFTIADHYRVQAVSDPRVSPDGRTVAYVMATTDLAAAERASHLWTVPAAGGAARQLTRGDHADSSPRWSPDGSSLLFVSDRDDDTPQLFLLPTAGGEARRLTDFSPGVADPVWSPDGRFVAFTAEVYPECGADSACNRKIADAWGDGPLQAHLADSLLYRHWTSWRDGRYPHVLLLRVADGHLIDLTPGAFDSPTFSLGGDTGFAFAPDSREVVVVSNHDPKPAESTNADLWRIPLSADGEPGEAVNLTAANPAWDGDPAYSPDGRFIAYRTQRVAGYESDLFRAALYDRAAGISRVLTESFRNWITDVDWSPDGRLLALAEVEGRNPLYEVGREDGAMTLVLRDATLDAWEVMPDGTAVVYARRSIGEPAELYRAAARPRAGGARLQLTRHNADLLAEVDFRPAEEMWVAGEAGSRVQVFLVKPHGFDPARRYPLILNVHGGPQSQWADAYRGDWQVYPGAGYVLAFPNPAGSTGFGQDVTDAIAHDWGGRVYREVMAVTDALAELPFVDPQRMGAMGWSYGGYMMMWLEGHTDRFKALAAMMGLFDLPSFYGATEELWFPEHDLGVPWESEDYRRWSPSQHVPAFRTPALVIAGERDYRVPYTQSLQFFTALQKRGVPSRLAVFSDAGHWPSWYEMAFYYTLHLDWFHRWLGGDPAPWDPERFLRNQVFGEGEGEGVEEPVVEEAAVPGA